MNTSIQKRNSDRVRELLDSYEPQIARALPRHLSPDRMLRIAMTTIAKSPKLLDCSPASLVGSVLECAQLGLEPDGVLGHCYIVPYGRRATIIVGYRGMIALALRSGQVDSVSARVVRDGDRFDFAFGIHEMCEHRPEAPADSPVTHAYAIARMRGGGHAMDVMTIDEIESIRGRSQSAKRADSPWHTDTIEMIRKTPVRRLFKYLPVSTELTRAVVLDEYADRGVDQQLDRVIDVGPSTASNYQETGDELADELVDENGG